MSATTAMYMPAETTSASVPGSEIDRPLPVGLSRPRARKNAANDVISPAGSAAAPITTAFAASTPRR
jgi:hypothetical protein